MCRGEDDSDDEDADMVAGKAAMRAFISKGNAASKDSSVTVKQRASSHAYFTDRNLMDVADF